MDKETPNYYAVIPAGVRYDKNLNSSEKLLYAEITALAQNTGKCWATNSYFAKLYGVDTRTIRRWLSHLKELGYITLIVIKNQENNVAEQRIIGIDKEVYTPGQKCPRGEDKNVLGGEDKNVLHNNTSINNINNNIYMRKFDEFYKAYPKKKSKQQAQKSFEKLKPDDELFKTIMDSLEKFKRSEDWKKDNGQFIPYPSTWLNQRRWEDEDVNDIKTKSTQTIKYYDRNGDLKVIGG